MHLTSKILERNQLRVPQQARDMTREVDQELIKLTELPSLFWRPSSFLGLEVDSVQAFWETRRTWDHMCYYTIVNQLHLPYMLCPRHTPQAIYSRMACVHASREILIREIAIRTFNPLSACSRLGDFMALVAGMTLILAHLVSHGHTEIDNSNKNDNNVLAHQRLSDRANCGASS